MGRALKKIVLMGGGGHCKVVLDLLERLGLYQVVGISDLPERQGQTILGDYTIDMVDTDLRALYPEVPHAFVSHGEDLALRSRLYEMAASTGYELPNLISPDAFVSPHAELARGTLVMDRAVVNAASRIGSNVTVNTGAIVEHDCKVGDHSHVAPGAVLCGSVHVGEMTLVGANSVVAPGVSIGDNVVVGAGSVVVRDVPDNVCVAGNPAHFLRTVRGA